MSYYLGIDVGTTFTAAAVWRAGRVEVASLGSRAAAVPSVVSVREDGTMLFGEAAARRALTEPHRVAREFKRRFGDPTPIILGGAPYSADGLMAKLLRWVVDQVAESEGGRPTSITVSHPANWGGFKQDLLRHAIRLADLDRVTTVTEPEAAAIYYASQERTQPGSVIAVYDLGGGTFDVAVLRKVDRGWEILGEPEGIEHLGGIDFDEAVFQHVAVTLGDTMDELDPEDTVTLAALYRLRRECTDAKEILSSDSDVSIAVLLPGVQRAVRLTRAEFEQMIRPALVDSIDAMKRALRSAALEASEVSAVLLVGGSSRIPVVAQLAGSELGRPVAVDAHPKYGIALGAAILAAERATDGSAVTTQISVIPEELSLPGAAGPAVSVGPLDRGVPSLPRDVPVAAVGSTDQRPDGPSLPTAGPQPGAVAATVGGLRSPIARTNGAARTAVAGAPGPPGSAAAAIAEAARVALSASVRPADAPAVAVGSGERADVGAGRSPGPASGSAPGTDRGTITWGVDDGAGVAARGVEGDRIARDWRDDEDTPGGAQGVEDDREADDNNATAVTAVIPVVDEAPGRATERINGAPWPPGATEVDAGGGDRSVERATVFIERPEIEPYGGGGGGRHDDGGEGGDDDRRPRRRRRRRLALVIVAGLALVGLGLTLRDRDDSDGGDDHRSPVTSETDASSTTVSTQTTVAPTAPTTESPDTVPPQPDPVELPPVDGRTEAEATDVLQGEGFSVVSTREPSDEVPTGIVIRSDPAGFSLVDPGITVTLFVSTGPSTLPVPDVVGLDEASARAALADFTVSVTNDPVLDPSQDGRIIAQSPDPDTLTERGSPVSIVVGELNPTDTTAP